MKDIISAIGCLLIVIIILFLVVLGLIKGVKYLITYEPKVCHYEYINAQGENKTASMCRGINGILYCGEHEWAEQATFIKTVCE